MQALRLPAMRGWYWMAEGFRLFRRNPPLLTFLVFGYFFLLLVINVVPLLGWIAASLCVPALSVSVMNGCRAADRGEPVQFSLIVSGFQRNRTALFILGALYLVATLLVFMAASALGGGALTELLGAGKPLDAEAMRALRVPLLLMIPVVMAFWFAPLLVAWDDVTPFKSLFFSFVAAVRNWRAFVFYALAVMFICMVMPALLLGFLELVSASLVRLTAVALTLPLLFIFVPTLFCTFYVSYREVFVGTSAPAGDGRGA